MSKVKVNLVRLVLYIFEKENGWRSIYFFDCLEIGSFIVCCMEWR